MKVKISYLKNVDKFLSKNHAINKTQIDKLLLKSIRKIIYNENTNLDLKKLKGNLSNFYRIRKGKIRILFSLSNDEVIIQLIVNNVDFRGNIYS